MEVSVTDAEGRLGELVRQAEAGEDVVLTLHGQPAARLVPIVRKLVAARRGMLDQMKRLIASNEIEIVPFTEATARRAGDAYTRWGKSFHPASLNFGDTFANALAAEHACPLLYVGSDFAQTDVVPAL